MHMIIPNYTCSSPTERNMSAVLGEPWFRTRPYLQLELFPHSVLFVGLDDDMKVIEVLDDEVVSLVHRQQDLLDRRIT